jgi:Tfp pilus assembly protein PilF
MALFALLISLPVQAAEQKNAPAIRVAHRPNHEANLIAQGYEALQQNNLIQAKQLYEKVLAANPKNTDALCGLATIALRNNQPDLAAQHYRSVLALAPHHAEANAALSGLRGGANETRLKLLLSEQPESAALHFALGNSYAKAERWPEAQQSWFLAYTHDAMNPDIVFNLAVSLDHLGKRELAARYYSEALGLADGSKSSFDRDRAKTRLQQLEAR